MSFTSDYTTEDIYVSGSNFESGQIDFGKMYFSDDLDKQLIKQTNLELIQKILNQRVYVYAIDETKTTTNVYGEAENKVFKSPKMMWARIMYNDPIQNFNSFSYDTQYNIQCDFYSDLLKEYDLKLREGDILAVGVKNIGTDNVVYFEISNLIHTQPLMGEIDYILDVRAICTTARKSLLGLLPRIQSSE